MTDWTQIRPIPRGRYDDRPARRWDVRRDHYAALPKRPLIIVAEMATPIIHAEPHCTHLDSILAFGALTTFPVESIHGAGGVSAVPLPLDLVWVSPDGLPLWACTPLRPVARHLDGKEYWHKRYPVDRAAFGQRLNAVTTAGRWKEYRTPVSTAQADRLDAMCIGHADEIRALLDVVTHIGKKGSMGYGRVARWSVIDSTHTTETILARRAVPLDYYAGRAPLGGISPSRAWTPPYWYAPWWRPCAIPE